MADERSLRDWHRLFGLLLTDFFSGSPFAVEIEQDLSKQQQLLDVLIIRRGRGRMTSRLPDGMDDLAGHNLITFKSHHEALDSWAMKELLGHFVAYRKLVSPTPTELMPEDCFRLYAVCARFPEKLSKQVPWQERQAGVYDCVWGTDVVRVVVAGRLPRSAHNAPLHLFSASPELVGFGQGAYQRHSESTSLLLRQLFENLREEGFAMSYTMEDFKRDVMLKFFKTITPAERRKIAASLTPAEQQEIMRSLPPENQQEIMRSLPPENQQEILRSLPPENQQEILQSLPPEKLLSSLTPEQIQQYLDELRAGRPKATRKPRRQK